MALSNTDRVSSSRLNTFAVELWNKIKDTFSPTTHTHKTDMAEITAGNGGDPVTDNTDLITSWADANGYSTVHPQAYRRKASLLWNYIKGKLTSDTGVNISGSASLAGYVARAQLNSNDDFNSYFIGMRNFYFAYNSRPKNLPTDFPNDSGGFGFTIQGVDGQHMIELHANNRKDFFWRRIAGNNQNWERYDFNDAKKWNGKKMVLGSIGTDSDTIYII